MKTKTLVLLGVAYLLFSGKKSAQSMVPVVTEKPTGEKSAQPPRPTANTERQRPTQQGDRQRPGSPSGPTPEDVGIALQIAANEIAAADGLPHAISEASYHRLLAIEAMTPKATFIEMLARLPMTETDWQILKAQN